MSDCAAACNKGLSMMQGDSWPLEFKINFGGAPIDVTTVEMVEFSLGELLKYYPGEVVYSEEKTAFLVPISQEESFRLRGRCRAQARVKRQGVIAGIDFGVINIIESQSKEVL